MCRELHERFMPEYVRSRNGNARASNSFLSTRYPTYRAAVSRDGLRENLMFNRVRRVPSTITTTRLWITTLFDRCKSNEQHGLIVAIEHRIDRTRPDRTRPPQGIENARSRVPVSSRFCDGNVSPRMVKVRSNPPPRHSPITAAWRRRGARLWTKRALRESAQRARGSVGIAPTRSTYTFVPRRAERAT